MEGDELQALFRSPVFALARFIGPDRGGKDVFEVDPGFGTSGVVGA
jgi:hypothetical protein